MGSAAHNPLDHHTELCTLLESLPEAVFIVDAGGRVVETNSSAERFTRRTREQLRGVHVEELTRNTWLPDGASKRLEFPRSAVSRALRGERISNERRVFFPEEEDRIQALVSANPMVDGGGRIIGALVVIRDVTELTALQERLAATERHQAIGQFAAGMIHDFNNVLDTIEKATTLVELKSDASASERKVYLELMHKAVRRGAEIISRLREYLRNESAELCPVDVVQLLDESLELTQAMWQAGNITVHRDLKPAARVHGNAADLRRVFTNLIVNAVQAMPNGGTLSITCEQVNSTVRVTVGDTGHGIPPEKRKKIFYPYFTTKQRGTGLGLSQAQRIVLGHKGNIRFHSEVGKGTRFIVDLPAMVEQPGRERPIVKRNDIRAA